MIAGGVGITPFLSIIRHLTASGWQGEIDLLHAVRTPADAIRAEALGELAKSSPRFRIHTFFSEAISPGCTSRIGRITASAIREAIPHVERRRVYLCGPIGMMKAVAEMLQECGVPTEAVLVESFGEPLAGYKDV